MNININPNNRDNDAILELKSNFVRDIVSLVEERLNQLAARGEDYGIEVRDLRTAWAAVDNEITENVLPTQRRNRLTRTQQLVDAMEEALDRGHVMVAAPRPGSEICDVHCSCGISFTAVAEELNSNEKLQMAHDDAATAQTTPKPAESSDLEDTHDDDVVNTHGMSAEAVQQVRQWGEQVGIDIDDDDPTGTPVFFTEHAAGYIEPPTTKGPSDEEE